MKLYTKITHYQFWNENFSALLLSIFDVIHYTNWSILPFDLLFEICCPFYHNNIDKSHNYTISNLVADVFHDAAIYYDFDILRPRGRPPTWWKDQVYSRT